MNSDRTEGPEPFETEEDPGQDWGESSLLDIENDLDALEEVGEFSELGDADVLGLDGNDLADLDLELDELEEYVDSHWTKLIE